MHSQKFVLFPRQLREGDGWKLGMEYERIEYAPGVCLINIVLIPLLKVALNRARKGGSSSFSALPTLNAASSARA
jgi:hypothetical protein